MWIDDGSGMNYLGKLLMYLRQEIMDNPESSDFIGKNIEFDLEFLKTPMSRLLTYGSRRS